MMDTETTQKPEHLARHRVIRVILGVCIVGTLACLAILLLFNEPPQRVVVPSSVPREAGSRPEPPPAPAGIRSHGVVRPKVKIRIMPEVAGRVVYVHSQLHSGGLIRANETIVQIDRSGYEPAVRRARAAVDEAQAKLDLALAAAGMSRESGRSLGAEGQADLPAVLHEPLVRQASAALESAKADLATAELQLSRTSVVLPFDVLIASGTVSLGQYVDVGQSLAVGYGTETFEVETPIRSEDLARLGGLEGLNLAGEASDGPHPAAEVKAVFAGVEHTWSGEVVRTTGQMDAESGRVPVIVEVSRPLDALGDRPGTPNAIHRVGEPLPLLPGMAVEVLIDPNSVVGTPGNAGNQGNL